MLFRSTTQEDPSSPRRVPQMVKAHPHNLMLSPVTSGVRTLVQKNRPDRGFFVLRTAVFYARSMSSRSGGRTAVLSKRGAYTRTAVNEKTAVHIEYFF